MDLTPAELRVLGALAEKELATPDAYPLSLNALVAACNQKTGREPVMNLSEREVADALDRLTRRNLAGTSSGAGSRVEKYRHALEQAFGLDRSLRAALALLLLRGPQTAGEIRSRSGRLWEFESLDEVEAALRLLIERDEPLVVELAPPPGRREPRYAHTLGGEVEMEAVEAGAPATPSAVQAARAEGDRLAAMEARIEALEAEVEALREVLDGLL